LKLFAEVVGKPTFPADSFKRIKNQMLAGFEYQKQNPGKLASVELLKRLYGDHPYALQRRHGRQRAGHHPRATARVPRQGLRRRQRGDRWWATCPAPKPRPLPPRYPPPAQGPALAKIAQPAEPKASLTTSSFRPSRPT
jgi:zinc protease